MLLFREKLLNRVSKAMLPLREVIFLLTYFYRLYCIRSYDAGPGIEALSDFLGCFLILLLDVDTAFSFVTLYFSS